MFGEKMKENYIATIVGCGVGDMLGMPVEGWKREQIRKYVGKITKPIDPVIPRDGQGELLEEDEFGKIKSWTKGLKKGEYTDDTILTLAIAESIGNKGRNINDIAKRHIIEYEKNGDSGFGRTTIDALKRIQQGISPLKSGIIGGPGNAPSMKMSSVGLYMDATGNYNEGLTFAEQISLMTHLDPRSVVSGVVQAHNIYTLLQGENRDEFVDSAALVCKRFEKPLSEKFTWYKQGNLTSRLDWIKNNKEASDEEAFQELGVSSAVYKSFPFAIFMFQKYWVDPINGLLETINFGGDCDTTGAMYGALCGAKNGLIFPKEWTTVLKDYNRLAEAGSKIWELKK